VHAEVTSKVLLELNCGGNLLLLASYEKHDLRCAFENCLYRLQMEEQCDEHMLCATFVSLAALLLSFVSVPVIK
jgi:hypothetical protein